MGGSALPVGHESNNWKAKAPYKVECFMWLVTHDACTHNILWRTGVMIWSRCCMCSSEVESSNSRIFALFSGWTDLDTLFQSFQDKHC